ncbi:GGDEF domain-containing protein [Terrihabitans sp. B22-R8]|uniref:GGDEF domain-containing protein n=1 Tax=Terrihabitans sp. B22-R8 TaxID=3425128 RepID=UPI00403C57B0
MIHVPTLIGCSVAVFAVIGGLFLFFWIREGRNVRHLWFGMPFLMGFLGGLCLLSYGFFPDPLRVRLGTCFILFAYASGWQAVRAMYGRRIRLKLILLPPLAWLLLDTLVFAPIDMLALNASARAALIAFYNGMAARELWLRRHETLPSRPVLFSVFVIYAVMAILRVPFTAVLPQPLGALPTEAWAVVTFNFAAVTQAMLVGAFIIAMMRERVSQHNYHLAMMDPLTGTYNRRAFEAAEGLWRSGETPSSLAVLLFDIDRFKSVNDRFGHAFGDGVILLAVRAAEQTLRRSDRLFRIGGEEFVCLLPNVSEADAIQIAERLRATFEEMAEEVDGEAVGATISVGVAAGAANSEEAGELLMRADEALYRAKNRGRNRVILASEISNAAA